MVICVVLVCVCAFFFLLAGWYWSASGISLLAVCCRLYEIGIVGGLWLTSWCVGMIKSEALLIEGGALQCLTPCLYCSRLL